MAPLSYTKWAEAPVWLRTRIRNLAKKAGVKLSPRKPGLQWDGKTIATGGLVISSILHEIAHYQVCEARESSRLKLADFGLGPGVETKAYETAAKAYVGSVTTEGEEPLASFLGMSYEWALGLDFHRTLYEHSWCQKIKNTDGISWRTICAHKEQLTVIVELRKLNLMKRNFPVLCK